MTGEPLRLLLRLTGAVAVVMGSVALAAGVRGVRPRLPTERGWQAAPTPAPSVDSEFRFFAAWYAAMGAVSWRTGRNPQQDIPTVRVLGLGWLLAAAARLLAIRQSGRPHLIFRLLLVIEAGIGAVVVAGTRTGSPGRATRSDTLAGVVP